MPFLKGLSTAKYRLKPAWRSVACGDKKHFVVIIFVASPKPNRTQGILRDRFR